MTKRTSKTGNALSAIGGWLLVWIGRLILSSILRTNKIILEGVDTLDHAQANGKRIFIGFWHSRLVSCGWAMRHRNITVIVSQSKDGEILARILQKWGYVTLRGSSNKGGTEALRGMIKALQPSGSIMAITMDGPVGPPRIAKRGSVALAAKMGAILVPLSASCTRNWIISLSWDKFQLPKPFGKIIVKFGEPIDYNKGQSDVEIAQIFGDAVTSLDHHLDMRIEKLV